MKAKEYAKLFNENRSVDTLVNISTQFVKECIDLINLRNAKTNSAIVSVFEEQDKKWRAFARLIEGVKPDGFEQIVKLQLPEIHKVWEN